VGKEGQIAEQLLTVLAWMMQDGLVGRLPTNLVYIVLGIKIYPKICNLIYTLEKPLKDNLKKSVTFWLWKHKHRGTAKNHQCPASPGN